MRASVVVLASLIAAPAMAQQLSLEIRNGLVHLQATNVPVRHVLAEWARVGGTKVVGGERVPGTPLTLSLEGVPEAKALDIVLRGAAGYVAAARAVPGAGSSGYDRILVLATSTPPAVNDTAAAANRGPGGRGFGVPPSVEPLDTSDVGVEEPVQNDAPVVNPFANAFGQAGSPNPFGQPVQGAVPFGQPNPQNPFGQPQQQNPFGQPMQPQNGQGLFVPVTPSDQPSFGIIGSTMPGVVQPPPPPGPRPQQQD